MVKYITYLFYKYYSTGPQKEYNYFSAIIAMMVLWLLTLFMIFGIFSIFFPNMRTSFLSIGYVSKFVKIAIAFLVGLVFYFILSTSFTENDMRNYDVARSLYRFTLFPVVIYIVICFISIVIIAFKYFKR